MYKRAFNALELVNELLERKGVFPKELAQQLKVSEKVVKDILSGNRSITVNFLNDIAKATGTNLKMQFEETP